MSRRTADSGPDPAPIVAARLAAAPKYRDIHPATLADVVRQERAAGGNAADLERRCRARLHKIAALHLLTTRPAALQRRLDQADLGDEDSRRAWCRQVLPAHVSTAERLADLDRFYPAILDLIPPPAVIADLACALNPFTLPWLRAATPARYTGYDLNQALVDLGNAFLSRAYPDCSVRYADVLTGPEPVTADLALLLKTYHCLENRQPGSGLRLVDQLAVTHVAVTFPTRAMNGRAATFAQRHLAALAGLAAQRGWRLARTVLTAEDILVISKG